MNRRVRINPAPSSRRAGRAGSRWLAALSGLVRISKNKKHTAPCPRARATLTATVPSDHAEISPSVSSPASVCPRCLVRSRLARESAGSGGPGEPRPRHAAREPRHGAGETTYVRRERSGRDRPAGRRPRLDGTDRTARRRRGAVGVKKIFVVSVPLALPRVRCFSLL
jgi:hypothetical protein